MQKKTLAEQYNITLNEKAKGFLELFPSIDRKRQEVIMKEVSELELGLRREHRFTPLRLFCIAVSSPIPQTVAELTFTVAVLASMIGSERERVEAAIQAVGVLQKLQNGFKTAKKVD